MSPLEDWVTNLKAVAAAATNASANRKVDLFNPIQGDAPDDRIRSVIGQMGRWDSSAKGLHALLNVSAAALGMRYILTEVSGLNRVYVDVGFRDAMHA
jgi:hypothetical protein